ncbi:MAG: hypothetical protein ACXW1P_11190 [Methylophilaceae bacterium]
MEITLMTTLFALLGGLLTAVVTYWFTKKREREAEWRKEKLAYYKVFVDSLSGIVDGDSTSQGQLVFARASNNLLLFAPQSVIESLDRFRDEISVSNKNRSQEQHDKFLSSLLSEIRKDIGISPPDDMSTFTARLWASGAK